MLSTSISAADTRRRIHRRQNSTPITEMPYIPTAHPGLQRAQQIQHLRGHRRGLSLDQRASYTPTQRLVPSLGPISQDDMSMVSTHTNNPGSPLQHSHPLQFAQHNAHAELVQPGHHFTISNLDTAQAQAQFQQLHQQQQFVAQSLDAESQLFFPPPQTQGHPQFSQQPTSSPQLLQQAAFQQQMALASSPAGGPSQIAAAKRTLEACFPGMNVNIQLMPTPVATPQKGPSSPDKASFEVSPVSLTLNNGDSLALEPNQALQPIGYGMPMYDPSMGQAVAGASFDGQLHSPHALSPTRSFIGSPLHQAMSPSQASTLLEVEGDASHMGSPLGNNPVSFADLSVQEMKGAYVTTGVAPEDVDKYISPQDPITRKYHCRYEGCTKQEGFGRRENIRAHVQTHLNDRAYRCLVCNSAFVRMNDLKRHSKIHKDKKEFQCECGSMFARHDALTRHKQRGCCSVHSSPLKANKKKPGRPKKHRPELDDRMAKSARQRELNSRRGNNEADPESEGSASEGERSPSPELDRTEFASFDEAAPLGSSQTLNEEEDAIARRSVSPTKEDQKPNVAFDEYAENNNSMSMNSTFDVTNLDVDNMDDYLTSQGTYPSSVANYHLSSSSAAPIVSSTSITSRSMGGLGITHSTPPPDLPTANANAQHLPKASPAHSLCNSLSTPPSSPPEMMHGDLPVFGLGDDVMVNKFWDFEGSLGDSKPSTRIEWDDVEGDLFGDELPSSSRHCADDFLDLY